MHIAVGGGAVAPPFDQKHQKFELIFFLFGHTPGGGVEDTKLEAKDTKKFRGQGQGQTHSRPRTQTQVFSKKKR